MSLAGAEPIAASPSAPIRRRRGQRWLVAFAIFGTLFWYSSWRRPTGYNEGESFTGTVTPHRLTSPFVPPRYRVATFNIHGGRDARRTPSLDAIAAALRGYDFVGLNEVRGPWLWQSADQAELLGRAVGATWLFAPTEHEFWHHEFGNGALSRLPVGRWQRLPVAAQERSTFRNWVVIDLPTMPALKVMVTHLSRAAESIRHAQLAEVDDYFCSLPAPCILMGDLNTKPDDPAMQRVLRRGQVVDALAPLNATDPYRIDWILTRGLTTRDCGRIDTGASDHPLYWIEFVLPHDE
jgi:endonuclease/exonuclease/phosphatase family metal-dependent hydrolase